MTKRLHRAATLPRLAVIAFAAVLAAGTPPALATLPCGEQPGNLPPDVAAQIKSQYDVIKQAQSDTELRGLVVARRRELRQSYADVDPLTLDRYLLWRTCQTISDDREQGTSRQFDIYSNYYQLLSEPFAKQSATTKQSATH